MRKSAIAAAVGLALAVRYQGAAALPQGGEITAGQGKIGDPANGALTIRQDSQRLAIDWLKFGIGVGQSVTFQQPGASAIALNRVVGNEASRIYGSLSANGQVFLLNPNGVLFAPGSQVNVGGLVASTLKMSNEDFLAGRYVFSKGEKAASVVNQGEITAGYAALLGPQVSNEGIITATLGTVALAAGEQVTLKLNGTSLVGLTVDKGALDALAANKHLIRADGGTVILTAKATDDIIRKVVNNDGIIEARSISQRDGVIRLESTGSGITAVNGALSAKSITVTGDKVGLFDGAQLTAPGGTILVGGNYQGQGPERNSTATYVTPGATLNADAVGDGDGGRVIVWSDGTTGYYGSISARGGAQSGNGGFVEVSGKQKLDFHGKVDLSAPQGRAGTLLLDPVNINLINVGIGTLDGFLPDILVTDSPGADGSVSVAALQGIASGTILLEATNDVNFTLPVTLQAGVDLTVTPNQDGVGGGAFNLSANLTADVLTVNGRLNHTAGTLSVTSGSISGLYDFSSSGGLSLGSGMFALSGGMNWSGSGTISGVNAFVSTLLIDTGQTAVISGIGSHALSAVTYNTLGTTQINLPAGNSLSVPLGAAFLINNTGVVEFRADQNAITGGGVVGNSGIVRNASAGTNTVSTATIQSATGTWEASTGRLNLAVGGSGGSFLDTTTILGGGVYFTGGTFTFSDFNPGTPEVVNGILNLDGATLHVANGIFLGVSDALNWTAGTISGANAVSSTLFIDTGAQAVISGSGSHALSTVTFNTLGTTQIDLPVGNSLNVPLGAAFLINNTGVVEFLADQNAITGTGIVGNSGTVRNASAGTNTVSTDTIQSATGTWEASTGRLNLAVGGSGGTFLDTTTILGAGVYFTGGTFTFDDFNPGTPEVVNGTLNLDGATLHVANGIFLGVSNALNWTAGTISGASAVGSTLIIDTGAQAVISGSGSHALSTVTYNTLGTTQIDLPAGNSLNVPLGAAFLINNTGVVEFLADQNAITGGGVVGSSGTVRNASAGTNTVSTDTIQSATGTWQASTGRLNLAEGGAGGNFLDTNTIVGAGVYFTGGTFTFSDFNPATPQQLNGIVNLDGAAFHVGAPTLTVSGPVNLHSDATVTLGTNSIVFQNTINGAHDLTITGSGAGTIALNGAIGQVTPLADLTITTGQALTLPLTTLTGNLDLTTGGDIFQTARLIVGGTADFDAGAGEVSLQLLANDFQNAVGITSTAAAAIHQITDANDLVLGAVSINAGAQLRLQTGGSGTATGHLTQTVPLSMSQLGVQTLSNTTSNISLGLANMMTNTTNPFNLENVGSGTWGNVTLRNDFGAGSLALNFNGAWAAITGDLDVRTVTGINQLTNIIVGGATTLDAGIGTISLQNVGNDFGGPVSVTGTAATDHRVTDANDLQLGAVSIHTNANLILQTGASGTATGHLTQTVPLTMSQLRVETRSNTTSDITLNLANFMSDTHEPFKLDNFGTGTWGDVRLRNDFVAGDLVLNPSGSWAQITGVLQVQTGAGISQTGPVLVGGAATLDAGMSIINLQNIGNDFQVVNLASTAFGGTHRITDRGDLQLGTISVDPFTDVQFQTGALGGNTGNLTQTVPLGTLASPMRQIRIQTLGNMTSDITLNLANFFSDTTEPFVLQNTGTGTWGNVSLRNDYGAGAFSVNNNGNWATISGNLSLQALTGITQANPITVVGTSRFETSSSQIQLTQNNDFQDTVTPVGGTNVAVFQGVLHDLKVAPLTAPQLTLSSGAGIDLSAGTYAASVGPLSLSALAPIELTSGPVTFSGANGISILGAVAGPGALVMTQTNPGNNITVNGSLGTFGSRLGGLTINESGSLGVQLGTATGFVNGDVVVTSPARIEMGSLAVSGTSDFTANNHIVQLDGNNDFVGVVTVLGGALTSINQNSVNPLRVAPLTTHGLHIQSQQSNVVLTAGTYQAQFLPLDIAALGGNSITLGVGTVTLDAASGLTLNGNVEGPGALVLNQQGAGASFIVNGTLGTSGARLAGLTIDNASATGVQLSGSGAFVAGDLDITSAGEIRLGTSAVTGTSRFEAANAPAVINGNNDFVGLVTVTSSNEVWIAQNSPNPLRVAPLSADFMFFDSQQSNVQLSAGTYEATVGNIRIDTGFPNSIALGAGTVTLDAQNGVQLNGSVAGPGALSIHQRAAGGLISVNGSLGTSATRLAGLTIDDQSTIGMPLGTTQAFVAGNLDITAAGPIQFGAMAVSGTSRFDFQAGVHAGVNIFDPGNDFGGVVTVVDGTFVFLAHSGAGPLRVAPLSAENMTIVSWQSDIQLSAGTYQSTVGSLDIGVLGGDAITLSAGTVTLDAANGVSMGGGDVHGPGGLIVHQRDASGYLLSESLGTPGSRLASLAIHNASTNNLSLGDVNVTGAASVQTAGDLTLPLGAVVSSSAGDVVLAGANFVNNAGSGALSAGGRWLVYSTSPAGSTEGGLAGATNTRLYNRTFAGDPPASIAAGNHLVYSAQPTLAVTGSNDSRLVGVANPPFTYSVGAGYVVDDGYTDTVANALLTGTLTSLATPASAAGPYAITQGTLASGSGYALSFTNGVLTVTAAPVPSVAAVPATPQVEPIRVYLDTLAGIQGNRIAAPLPVEYDRMVTIENGGIRLPEGLQP